MCEQWSRDKTLNLIEAYHSQECLWKTSNRDYTDRIKRNEAWEEVAKTAGCDVRSVEKKIKSLRTQFMNSYKAAHKKSNGSGTDEDYTPKWFAYSALQFILQGRPPPKPQPPPPPPTEKDSHEGKKDEMAYQRDEELFQQQQQQPPPPEISDDFHQASTSFKKIIKKRKPSDEHQYMDSPMDFVQTSTASNDTRDEFSIFADYVASELRTIGDRRALAVAKHNINTVLFEATTGMYDQQIANGHD